MYSNSSDNFLNSWLENATPAEKEHLHRCGLNASIHFRFIRLNIPFLQALVRFWDASYHVFRFGGIEVCPTLEDFAAIMSVPTKPQYFLSPSLNDDMSEALKVLAGCDQPADDLSVGALFDLPKLRRRFLEHSGGELVRSIISMRILSLHVLGRHYFIEETDTVDLRLCHLTVELEEGDRSIIHIILGETLLGLDRSYEFPMLPLRGSPLLLQVWAMERLGFLTTAVGPYTPSRHLRRSLLPSHRNQTFLFWIGELNQVTSIAWRVNGWETARYMRWSGDHGVVVLMGLHRTTFYCAERLCRQFGLPQGIPERLEVTMDSKTLTQRWIYFCKGNLLKGETRAFGDFGDLQTDDSYGAWMRSTKLTDHEKTRHKARRTLQRSLRRTTPY